MGSTEKRFKRNDCYISWKPTALHSIETCFFSVTMASRFEKVDEEYIEELKAKGENEKTKNSTKW